MKEIPLTQGYVALVDDEDFDAVMRYRWNVRLTCGIRYAKRLETVEGKRKQLSMHRFLLNPPSDMQVDHKNGNGLDNRRSNLRVCTLHQNVMNTRKRSGCSSQYKGVYWHKQRKRWVSKIKHNLHHKHIGQFIDEIDAAMAYDEKAKEFFGEFARLNFPSPAAPKEESK